MYATLFHRPDSCHGYPSPKIPIFLPAFISIRQALGPSTRWLTVTKLKALIHYRQKSHSVQLSSSSPCLHLLNTPHSAHWLRFEERACDASERRRLTLSIFTLKRKELPTTCASNAAKFGHKRPSFGRNLRANGAWEHSIEPNTWHRTRSGLREWMKADTLWHLHERAIDDRPFEWQASFQKSLSIETRTQKVETSHCNNDRWWGSHRSTATHTHMAPFWVVILSLSIHFGFWWSFVSSSDESSLTCTPLSESWGRFYLERCNHSPSQQNSHDVLM